MASTSNSSSDASPDTFPAPTDVATLLLEQGIAPEHFAKLPGIVLVRPLDAHPIVMKGYDAEVCGAGFRSWVKRWRIAIEREGAYVEK